MLEKLQISKEETELTIQELNKTAKVLEGIKSNIPIGCGYEIVKRSLKEIDNEIEWNEQILEEIQGSIEFELMKNGFL